MRRLLAVCWVALVAALVAVPAPAAISPPAQTKVLTAQSGQNPTLTFDANVVANRGLVIGIFWKGAVTVSSVTGCGGTWLERPGGQLARPTDGFLNMWGAQLITGGSCTITVNFSGAPTAGQTDLFAAEYPGVATSGPLWDSANGSGTATSGTDLTTGSFSPTLSDGAIVAFAVSDDTTASAGTLYTSRHSTNSTILEDRLFTSSVGSVTASASFSTAMTKGGIIAGVLAANPAAPIVGVGPQFNGTCNLLQWNANSEPDLAGYRLYDRVSLSAAPTLIATFGTQITSIPCASLGFNPGQHYVSLSAFDSGGVESPRTSEVPFFLVTTNHITDLRVTTINATDMTVSWTEVDDGAGAPAKYLLRYNTPTLEFGSGLTPTTGTCSPPITGTTIGATKFCQLTGLATTTAYQFQVVPFRGTLDLDAVFGPLSNIASGTTGGTPPPASDLLVLVSEGFDRANGPLGPNWQGGYDYGIPLTDLVIASNAAQSSAIPELSMQRYVGLALPDDQWGQFVISAVNSGACQSMRLFLRMAPPPAVTAYEFVARRGCTGDTTRIGRWNNGTLTMLWSESATTWGATDVLRGEARADQFCLFRNGTQQQCVTDGGLPSGDGGLAIATDTAITDTKLDSVQYGTFSVAVTDECGCS